jgi:hypothetical protein
LSDLLGTQTLTISELAVAVLAGLLPAGALLAFRAVRPGRQRRR